MRNLLLSISVFLCIAANVSAASIDKMLPSEPVFKWSQLELRGQLKQGALLRGQIVRGQIAHGQVGTDVNAAKTAKVWLNDREVQVSEDGFFAIGFGRDAKLTHKLKWQTQDGQSHSQTLELQKREYKVQKIEGLPPKMVTPPDSVLERIRKDNRDVAAARKLRDERIDFMQAFQWPAKGAITGVYGSQRVLNGKPKRPHFGVDVAGPIGHPVYAPADGVVTLFVPDMYYSGGTMIIDHGHGISSTFLHLSKSHVKAGDVVKQGELVAEIGNTGRVTGAHLDWRMNWLDQRIDPALIVPAKAE